MIWLKKQLILVEYKIWFFQTSDLENVVGKTMAESFPELMSSAFLASGFHSIKVPHYCIG